MNLWYLHVTWTLYLQVTLTLSFNHYHTIMKALQNFFAPTLALHFLTTSGVLCEPSWFSLPRLTTFRAQLQRPIMNIPNIALPPFNNHDKGSASPGENEPSRDDEVILSDVIGKQRAINIFASFTRDNEAVSRRLDDNTQNTTVLAPLNSQIEKLPRKPWEDPQDYEVLGENAYEGEKGEDRAQRNLRRFVEAHIIPLSPWKEGEKVQSLGGVEVWWEENEGQKFVSICLVAEKLPDPLADSTREYRGSKCRRRGC